MNSNRQEPPIDRITELQADRALQGLDSIERAELERLVADFESDGSDLDRAVAEISLSFEPTHADPIPRALLERLEADADAFLNRGAWPGRSIAARVLPWVIGLAAACFLVIWPWLKNQGALTLTQEFADVPTLNLAATDHPLARGATGTMAWSGDRQAGYLALRGLAEVEADRGVYQLWIFDKTRDDRYPVDGGTFVVTDANTTTLVPIHPTLRVREPTLFAITLEPPGGVVVSDRKRIVLTAAPGPESGKP